jgi:hypothetical protein
MKIASTISIKDGKCYVTKTLDVGYDGMKFRMALYVGHVARKYIECTQNFVRRSP